MIDDAPKAKWYYSDGFDAYKWLWYHFGRYEVSIGKTDTYSVEADNAELRHYLARLHRSTRCFSKCLEALRRAIDLFVRFWNVRQLRQQTQPQYLVNLIDCVSLRV